MPDQTITVPVHPIELGAGDYLQRDPDDTDREVRWWITAPAYTEGPVVVADYVTEDGAVGRHLFEDPSVWLEVVPPFAAPPIPRPRREPESEAAVAAEQAEVSA